MAIASSVAVAHAGERNAGEYQKLFEQWGASIAEMQKKTQASTAALAEIETLRTLIGQAQAFVASDKLEEIQPIEERAVVLIRLAQVKVKRAEAEQRAMDAEAEAKAMQEEADRAKAEADALAARYAALEKQGL